MEEDDDEEQERMVSRLLCWGWAMHTRQPDGCEKINARVCVCAPAGLRLGGAPGRRHHLRDQDR